MLRTYQWLLIIFVAIFSVLTDFWIIKTSQVKEISKEENKVKKIEDSSNSITSHFWSIFRSPFSTYYIPFQSSGSQESNALNRVWFGAKMRKIWPSEDNCSKLVRNSHNTFSCEKFAQHISLCEFRTSPCVVRNLLCFCRLHMRSSLMHFLCKFLSYPYN